MRIKPLLSNGKRDTAEYLVDEIVTRADGEKLVVFYASGYQCVPLKTCEVINP